MSNAPRRTDSAQPTIRVRGRARTYSERRRIGRRDYFLLEQIGSPLRPKFLAFDPQQGPGGDFFLVQRLDASETTEQRLRVLRRLKDDSLPRVVEWHRSAGSIELVSSWVEGVSLADYLAHIRAGRRPAVAPSHAVRLIHCLASVVCKLHHKLQVGHGDIQPANLILTSHPSRLVLVDFGSAWTMDRAATRQEGDGRHRVYGAPELVREDGGYVNGFLSDQFSVGVILYELLTGQVTYRGLGGKAGWSEHRAQVTAGLEPPSKLLTSAATLPRSSSTLLDEVVRRSLQLTPEQRYPDRHAWLDAMSRLRFEFQRLERSDSIGSLFTRVADRLLGRFRRPPP